MRRVCLLSLAMLASSGPLTATASNVAGLDVAGRITPGSCDVSMSSGDTVDIGPISAGEFVPGEDKVLEPTAAFMTVSCLGSPTRFRLKATDTSGNVASTPGSSHYGLGMNGRDPIGYFRLGIAADIMTYNGFVLKSNDGGAGHDWGTPVHEHVAFDHDDETYGFAATADATEPAALAVIAVPLSITPVLAKDPVLTTEVTLAGQVTIEVLY